MFSLIPIRLALLNLCDEAFYTKKINKETYRHPILDRKGRVLAFTEETTSIYVDPLKVVEDEYLEEFFPRISIKLQNSRKRKSRFLWAQRHVDPISLNQLRDKKILGVYAKNDYKRTYIAREKFSNLLGFCDADLNGKAGIENSYDKTLRDKEVTLNIDAMIQSSFYDLASQVHQDYDTEGVSGMIIEVASGNILAMVSVPSPAVPADFLHKEKRNRNLDPKEVGSVLKLINVATALESGQYTPDSIVDARGPLKIGDYEINDFFGVNQEISLRESLWRSSNVANARVALSLGSTYQKHMLDSLGLLSPIDYLPGCKVWPIRPGAASHARTATLSYGYGIGLSTLHLAQAVLAVITGYKLEPALIPKKSLKVRVFSRETVKNMLSMMEEVVTKGNCKNLKTVKSRIGAKTGTANMIVKGQYVEGMNFITLVVTLPMPKPKLLIILQAENPKKERLKSGRFTTAAKVLNPYVAELFH